MPHPPRHILWCGAVLYALGELAFRLGDALFDIPPGVEPRHYLNTWWKD